MKYLLCLASAVPIQQYSVDVRKANVLTLSASVTCSDCVTLEQFYDDHALAFVLFWERQVTPGGSYKTHLVDEFLRACGELAFTGVVCGQVDILIDRPYAQRYIDPKTAPAHILVKNGEPVLAQQHHIDRLMQYPAATNMLWFVKDALKPVKIRRPSHVSGSSLDNLLRKSKVVVGVIDTGKPCLAVFWSAAELLRGKTKFALTSSLPGVAKDHVVVRKDGEVVAQHALAECSSSPDQAMRMLIDIVNTALVHKEL